MKAQADAWELEMRKKKQAKSIQSPSQSSAGSSGLRPLKLKGDLGYKPLPSIQQPMQSASTSQLESDLAEKKVLAEKAHELNRRKTIENRANEEQLKAQLKETDKFEMEKRATHMKEQREKLLLKKKRERDEKARIELEQVSKQDELEKSEKMIEIGNFVRQKAAAESKSSEDQTTHLADKKRDNMRMALARRMKMDLIEAEEVKMIKAQEEQFAELDRKLMEVEINRKENIQQELLLSEKIRRNQAKIARNIQQSARGLTEEHA